MDAVFLMMLRQPLSVHPNRSKLAINLLLGLAHEVMDAGSLMTQRQYLNDYPNPNQLAISLLRVLALEVMVAASPMTLRQQKQQQQRVQHNPRALRLAISL